MKNKWLPLGILLASSMSSATPEDFNNLRALLQQKPAALRIFGSDISKWTLYTNTVTKLDNSKGDIEQYVRNVACLEELKKQYNDKKDQAGYKEFLEIHATFEKIYKEDQKPAALRKLQAQSDK